MTGSARTRLLSVLATGVVSGAALGGCGGDPGLQEAGATGSPAQPASATEESADLSAGLLPAEAFGPDARVVPVTPEMLAGAGLPSLPTGALPSGAPPGVRVLPEGCADVLAALPQTSAATPDVAAQVAVSGTQVTVQALARGPAVADVLDTVEQAVTACPEATVEVPGYGEGTVTVASFVPELQGAEAIGVEVGVTATAADGRELAVSGLAALVQDGDRLLALATGDPHGGAVGKDDFLALVAEAHDAQAALD